MRSRFASHPETPDNPLDTRMDHTTHSLDTWAPKISMVHSNPWHRTYQRTTSGNPPVRYRTLQPVRQNRYPPTTNQRITDCGEGAIRNWTRTRIASLLAPKRQAAIVWITAHLVEYRMQRNRLLKLNDYIDFLRQAKWKAYQKSPRQHIVGNYLDIIWLRHGNYNRRWITKQLNDN